MKNRTSILVGTRHFFYALLSAVLLSSCESIDNSRCMSTVQKAYPKATVFPLPDKDYRYIVVDSCNRVLYVRVIGKWDEITTVNEVTNCR